MSDCITVLVAALLIAVFLGDRDDCKPKRKCSLSGCDIPCGCN